MSDFFRSDDDTPLRRQRDKETHGDTHRDPPPWTEGDTLGEFVLEELLGSGSSGFVYRVFDKKTQRHIALKILRTGDSDALMRNRLGFRRMTQIEHPNLLYVDRIHKIGDYTALAMDLVRGVTFNVAVRGLKELPREEAFQQLLTWMRDFSSGLATMHGAGLTHRDIKPQNLMVDDQGRGRVIDYGLVDTFNLDHTEAVFGNVILGTPHYLAPEVICRQLYLPAGDIFALGIVMIEALQYVALNNLQTNTSGGRADGLAFLHVDGPGVERNKTLEIDAELILTALDGLSEHVPQVIGDACRQMLDRDAAERPTALRLSRLGSPPQSPSILNDNTMVGREVQLAEIHHWADLVFAGKVSRLNITGPSGIGKTRLLEEAIAYIESKRWGQVFRGRCRLREDSALQSFEQICDAIANRYRQGDRDRLKVDAVSFEVLSSIFPVLENVMEPCLEMPPVSAETPRLVSLEAAIQLSKQIREIGPLFIIIDDAQ
ncbi:MAG: serine/threonine-protein kinase, partial [Rubripirellula sp.]